MSDTITVNALVKNYTIAEIEKIDGELVELFGANMVLLDYLDGNVVRIQITEADLDDASTLADLIAAQGKGSIAYRIWDEPYGDDLGTLLVYVPKIGSFTGHCGASGAPAVLADELHKIADETPSWQLARKIGDLTGRRVIAAFDALGQN